MQEVGGLSHCGVLAVALFRLKLALVSALTGWPAGSCRLARHTSPPPPALACHATPRRVCGRGAALPPPPRPCRAGALYDAYAVLDVAALRAMASEKLVEAMQQAHGEVQRHAGHKLTGVTATVNRCAVRGVNLWGPESVGVFDRRWPAALTASTSKSWLVVTVAVDATLEAEYERAPLGGGAGSAGAGAEGGGYGGPARAVKSLVDRRGTWLFVRGPLPTGRSRSLHSSWFVLAWW